jgi:hypothetical protein
MLVSLELHNTGDPSLGAEIQVLTEHHLGDRPGDWRVSIVGSRGSDGWEMKVWGPNGFERSYTLAGGAGEHQPLVIANVLLRLLPAKKTGNRKGSHKDKNVCRANHQSSGVRGVSCTVNRPLADRPGTQRGHNKVFLAAPRTPSSASVFL